MQLRPWDRCAIGSQIIGTNVDEGKAILAASDLNIHPTGDVAGNCCANWRR